MKVDTSKMKKSSSELTPECRLLIDQLTKCRSKVDISRFLETVTVWTYGKCELYHWTHILDRFDKILEEGARQVDDNEFMLYCDLKFSKEDVRLLLLVLNFTTLLIEHSFSRHLYNSVEHLTQLLSSQNMDIVLAVLNLLYMFSKRSNFIPRLSLEKKDMLLTKLYNIAERWGDPNYGLALIDCCIRKPKLEFLYQLSIEYSDENGQVVLLEIPDMVNTCKGLPISEVVKAICGHMKNPSETVKMRIAHRIRLVSGFKDQKLRLQFVQARLQAISVLIYSNALQDNVERILYSGFGEELCELIDKEDVYLVEIRAAVLRTLTSMLHFDRNPNVPRPGSRLAKIIQYTGAERQGGILPLLVRDCIISLTNEGICEKYPLVLATSLFSLLYHLASYEAGGHALVKSGMMKSLLQVINWPGVDLEHITFVTRAVRVIDLITNIDISKFHQCNGLNIFIDRMEKEINCCRDALDNLEIKVESIDDMEQISNDQGNGDNAPPETFEDNEAYVGRSELQRDTRKYSRLLNEKSASQSPVTEQDGKKMACVTQRAALLKSMLNFLKKSIQDHAHFNGMRNIMESSLPKSLQHIISNAEYYGPSLFLLATDVVTVYVFNEPSLLSSLQETGLTNIILRSLLQKEVPATREILGSLPNIFSALCLNERGLMEFMSYDPFDKFLRVLLSPDYLVAMRRRRSSDPLGDTSTNLGNAMDDLMKHHPYLRTDAIEAIVRLLHDLVRFGSDAKYVCWRAHKDNSSSIANTINPTNQQTPSNENTLELRCNENDSSGEDDEDDDEMSSASQQQQHRQNRNIEQQVQIRLNHEREAIPLIDYILNVMKFIDAIFSNSSNGDHCREFVMHGGLQPLLRLLSLPNLPIDSPVSTTAQAVANVCKSILNLAHETTVIDIALEELSKITNNLQPLISNFNFPGESILLRELMACPKLDDGFSTADYTPLLHNMSSVHGYVVLLVHLCRNASSEMRLTLLSRWGNNSGTGLQLLQSLVRLYISLVWESTILLSLCSDEINETGLYDTSIPEPTVGADKDDLAMKKLSSIKFKIKADDQLRYIKSLLAASSRLGRALAELFGTLVKLSVGTPQARQRRNNDYSTNTVNSKIPTADAKEIARVLSSILVNGFSHENNVTKPAPKLKLTFLICSVGFTGPMLFDDKRSCFHLMISQFCEENGLGAFFDMFYWALSLDNSSNTFGFENCLLLNNILQNIPSDTNEYPAGTGEFIDAWLQLLEKMVNPRGILDSPYALSTKGSHSSDTIDFEPIFYLIQMHQLAMHVVRRIWKRKPIPNYGVSITETIMAILKHIIKSHNMISNRYKARLDEIQNADKLLKQRKKTEKSSEEGFLNANHFKVLTDMGFGPQHVMDALRNTRSLEQATEFLLNHPEATTTEIQNTQSISNQLNCQQGGTDMDIDTDSASTSGFNRTSDTKGNLKFKQYGGFHNVQIVPNEIFNQFCNDVFERVFAFMEYLPETVNTGTELLSALYRQNNQQNKREFIMNLVNGVTECMEQITNVIKNEKIMNTSELENIFFGEISTKLLIRLKVSTILLDENYSDIRKEFCAIVSHEKFMHIIVNLLYETEALLNEQTLIGVKPQAPQWLQNFIEFVDAIDNVCIILQRRENMRAVCTDKWRWYDVSTGKWNSYTETNNNLLKNAFAMGEKSQVIHIGRQRYTVNFNYMTQVSEASGSHRSVLPDLKISEAISSLKNGNTNIKTDSILTRSVRSKPCGEGVIYKDELICLRSLTGLSQAKKDCDNEENIVQTNEKDSTCATQLQECTPLGQKKMKVKNTTKSTTKKGTSGFSKHNKKIILHEEKVGLSRENCIDIIACLVHLLRPEFLVDFETKISIMKLCARLTKDYENAKAFYKNGGISLLLKMRQACGMMEFPTYAIVIIRHVLEAPSILQDSIERILTIRSSPTVPVGHRDLVYFLTQVSSAVARHPKIFLLAAKQSLQADNALSSNFPIDDSRFLIKCQTQNKPSDTITNNALKIDEASEETVKDILRAIIQPCEHYGGLSTTDDCDDSITGMGETSHIQLDNSQPKISSAKKHTENIDVNPCCCSWHIPSTSHTHQKPILPRSTLLKILADAVRSYQCLVPKIIIEYVYMPSDSPLIKKPQTCISFILDHFLPITKRQQDPEVSMMSRVLLSSLSDCVSQPTVQSKLVEELHEAIVRTLTEPSYTEKHVRLQVLIGLIPIMIESPMLSSKVHLQRNNMYRILLKQGIMTDLAKLAQYKDLSNSNTLTTVHSTLRPMEILLRLTITPGTLSSRKIFFGTPPNGNNAIMNRRLYPRITSRISNENSGSVGSEHVLRDIIRNVLSDRRQAFDFILNGEDIFLDSEEPTNSMSTSNEDTAENVRESQLLASTNLRPQINFDQLWDDLLQNGHVAFLGRSSDSNNGPVDGNRMDTRNNRSDGNQVANTENGGNGGSDGASTSSELVATVVDNSTNLGDVSTSESESDSNASTENERNDDDEDDDEDEDGNEEDVEDHSETDADEETRQFIEVFDHIYEPESSETASNDADDEASEVSGRSGEQVVNGSDADDEVSEVSARISEQVTSADSNLNTENRMMNSPEIRGARLENQNDILLLSDQDNVQASSNVVSNMVDQSFADNNLTNAEESSVRTNPSSVWVAPRLGPTRADLNFVTNTELESASTTNHERSQNNTSTVYVGSTNSQTTPIGSLIQRRESTRRLILLDQQYCTLMPSFNNPTEEGQLDIFNQDSLHWWLEEAKHLDLESQTDACLYIAHLLIPFLIRAFKDNQKAKSIDQPISTTTYNSPNRRSAIPVFIQQTTNLNSASENISSANGNITERNENTALSTDIQEQQDQISNDGAGEVEYSSEEENPTILVTNEGETLENVEDDFEDEQDESSSNTNPTNLGEEMNTAFDIPPGFEMRTVLEPSNSENVDNIMTQASQHFTTNRPEDVTTENIEEEDITLVSAVNQELSVQAVQDHRSDDIEAVSEAAPSGMNAEVRAALGDLQVPEGVDPSFLAALPAEMREEVINEHLRMQRIRQRAQQNAIQVAHDSLIEVNPEFLAALPPNIQTEVLMQQRIEQQRQAASAANPDDPVDTAAFFQNLPESLRRAILTDMEESQIASLPPDLAAEAQYLRRDWESRNGPNIDTPHVLRRFPSSLQNLTDDSRWHSNYDTIWYEADRTQQSQHHQHTTIVHQHQQQIHGKPIALLFMEDDNNLLDPDCLATILLFLFTEDTKINYTRFHRVIRNLCYHAPTRSWIIQSLISIIQKTNEDKTNESDGLIVKPNWLKLRIDAAFGYKSNVFIINEITQKNIESNSTTKYNISINPQAAQMVVKNCLDLLFVLARHFPRSFVPFKHDQKRKTDPATESKENNRNMNISTGNTSEVNREALIIESNMQRNSALNITKPSHKVSDLKLDEGPSTSKAAANRGHKNNIYGVKSKQLKKTTYNTNTKQFWDVLLKIDLLTPQRLTNMQDFPLTSYPRWEWEEPNVEFQSFNDTPFSKLLEMLPYKVICRSPQLTDMLVKLLASLSGELPKESDLDDSKLGNKPSDMEEKGKSTATNVELKHRDESSTDAETKLYTTGYRSKSKLYSKNFSQLQLVTEVLTHQCGTVDGLDNISKLIVNLSQCSHASNAIFLEYLSSAVFGLAKEVRLAIQNLLEEIRSYKVQNKVDNETKCETAIQNKVVLEGIMQDRFTSENVIISAPSNFKPSCELQLPSIKKLLSPSSAQLYFLKTLKIFIQVREIFYSEDPVGMNPANKKPTLSQIISLQDLWNTLSECLVALEESKDEYAVLVLQPTVEAFFLIHATNKKNEKKNTSNLETQNSTLEVIEEANSNQAVLASDSTDKADSTDIQDSIGSFEFLDNIRKSCIRTNSLEVQQRLDKENFLIFAEKHRTVLNQILRQSPIHLSDGPFAVLVDHTRILDFDVKRKFFQTELERIDEGVRREENTVSVRRVTVFEDSFRVLYRLGPEEWKNRFYIVFEDEEGQDAGGLLREWYVIISREIFNPMYALFCVSPGDRVTYMINPSSHANPNHLSYFKFVGRVIAKAIHDNKLLECYFTRSFYKHILGKQVKYTDMESQDYEFYKGLDYLMKNDISTLGYELTFSTEIQEFGVTQVRDLIPNGRNIAVTEENKFDYVQLVCQLKMSGSIRQQLDAFLEGFYDIIPKHLISIFNEQELELLISGLPDIDIEDLRANTEYHKYTSKSLQIQWFWRALRSFDQADRAKFLQFVTGTSKVPLQGFGSLEGMNGIQRFQIHRDDRSTDRLPCAHTCFNQLDLPMYKSYEKLRSSLLKAIHECSEGFGFA
ncbi:E3 ubiquitin-protein ligase HUWE1 [Bactrocera dorsalis]|uniref:HECT-type E3 ubiquitin transferase n=1 Tax=Bactrocera dorsalis TaxID=27457 RepID=A0A6I9VP93_BACDO|nr:E3 ubiquitin-protein ligase HUWE1 [Bactrocera dorsalis]XP_049310545.1 E3 ubiquitin-protein ligase HUWE1 [Bactrocera dorsalis]